MYRCTSDIRKKLLLPLLHFYKAGSTTVTIQIVRDGIIQERTLRKIRELDSESGIVQRLRWAGLALHLIPRSTLLHTDCRLETGQYQSVFSQNAGRDVHSYILGLANISAPDLDHPS